VLTPEAQRIGGSGGVVAKPARHISAGPEPTRYGDWSARASSRT
jgi:hypothetical protein